MKIREEHQKTDLVSLSFCWKSPGGESIEVAAMREGKNCFFLLLLLIFFSFVRFLIPFCFFFFFTFFFLYTFIFIFCSLHLKRVYVRRFQ